jgi:hypothetical protein
MGKERLGTEDFRDLLMDQEALKSISKAWSYTTDLISFITSQGHTVTGEWPAAANRRRTNFQQLPLTRTSNTQTSERDFVWQNWKKFQILYYIQCEVPLYWRALVCRDVAHCHWMTCHRHAANRIILCVASWKYNICSSCCPPLHSARSFSESLVFVTEYSSAF